MKPKAHRQAPAMALGRIVRSRREKAGLSQEAFAELAGLSKNYVGNIERGEYEVSISVLHRIAQIFKLSASDLLQEAGY